MSINTNFNDNWGEDLPVKDISVQGHDLKYKLSPKTSVVRIWGLKKDPEKGVFLFHIPDEDDLIYRINTFFNHLKNVKEHPVKTALHGDDWTDYLAAQTGPGPAEMEEYDYDYLRRKLKLPPE